MRAILRLQGKSLAIYTLERGTDSDEVRAFLDSARDRGADPAVVGFIRLLRDHVADNGLPRSNSSLFDSWKLGKKDGRPFSELKKGDFRIGCYYFPSSRRLLLLTTFRKRRDREPKQYKRAMGYLDQFLCAEVWEDEDGNRQPVVERADR